HRALYGDLARIAERPRPRGARRLRGTAGLPGVVLALAVALQPFEDLDQSALPQLSRSPRRDLQPTFDTLKEASLLQRLLDLLQSPDVAHGILPERSAQPLLVHVVQRRARVVGPHRTVQLLVV